MKIKNRIGNINAMTHGHTRYNEMSRTYNAWRAMMQRCHNQKNNRYYAYGARGIKVCLRWHKFENFLADMGECPEGLTIDRIDNSGHYELENCKWSSSLEQMNNTSRSRFIEYRGEKKTLAQWSRIVGIGVATLWMRLKKGWSVEEALFLSPSPISRVFRDDKQS